jgi:hypothetical protein
LVFSAQFNISLENFVIFDVAPGIAIWKMGLVALLFLSVGHAMNFFGDVISFRAWNSTEKMNGPIPFGGASTNFKSKTEGVIGRISDIERHLKEFSKGSENPDMHEYISCVREIRDELQRLTKGVAALHWYGRLYLYGWYGVVPGSLALIAIITCWNMLLPTSN